MNIYLNRVEVLLATKLLICAELQDCEFARRERFLCDGEFYV